MEAFKKKAIKLLMNFAVDEDPNPTVIPYYAQKYAIPPMQMPLFKRNIGGGDDEMRGRLGHLCRALEEDKNINIHSLFIVKDGRVILDVSAPGYDSAIPHLAQSMSKTVTGIGILMLADDGAIKLTDRISDILTDSPEVKESNLTVYDLLSMKCDNPFAEIGTVTEENWLAGYFSAYEEELRNTEFSYNSINSYILGRIIAKVSGMTYTDFISDRLFKPLGINAYFIEKCPLGHEKAGFGIYLGAEAFAAIAYMLLSGGKIGNNEFLKASTVDLMTSLHSKTPADIGDFNYGLHLWVNRDSDEFLLNGMLGQNALVMPSENAVAVITAANNELFQGSRALPIIREALTSQDIEPLTKKEFAKITRGFFAKRCKIRFRKKRSLLLSLFGLIEREPYLNEFDLLHGEYAFPDNTASQFPLFARVMQNNYTGGIKKLTLERYGNEILARFTEGGNIYSIPCGLYGFADSEIDINGEKYRVRAGIEALEDENRNPLYKLLIVYPELPYSRLIRIEKTDNGIKLQFSEEPNEAVAIRFLDGFMANPGLKIMLSMLEKKAGENYIEEKLKRAFNPELYGISTKIDGYTEIIARENAAAKEEREINGKLIKSLVGKFLKDDSPDALSDEKEKDGAGAKSFLGKMLSSIFGFFT